MTPIRSLRAHHPVTRAATPLALALAALALAVPARADVTGATVFFGDRFSPSITQPAGSQGTYNARFVTTHALGPGDSITVSAPAGTRFPAAAGGYFVFDLGPDDSVYAVLATPSLANDGATVTVALNAAVQIPAGDPVALQIAGTSEPFVPGSYTASVSTSEEPVPVQTTGYTLTPAPASIAIESGDQQSATAGSAFATPLGVQVEDGDGAPLAGVDVTFSAPATGATGTFDGSATAVVTTNANGLATAPTLVAGAQLGSFAVTASAGNASAATFQLEAVVDALPPQVTTKAATRVTRTGAVLHGSLQPQGVTATYWFEWGGTTAYGKRTPVRTSASASLVAAKASFANLRPGRTYHFRLVAINVVGETFGQDVTFTTKR